MQILSLSWEDLLEEEMATHSSILAWETPWTEDPGVAISPWRDHKELDMTEALGSTMSLLYIKPFSIQCVFLITEKGKQQTLCPSQA